MGWTRCALLLALPWACGGGGGAPLPDAARCVAPEPPTLDAPIIERAFDVAIEEPYWETGALSLVPRADGALLLTELGAHLVGTGGVVESRPFSAEEEIRVMNWPAHGEGGIGVGVWRDGAPAFCVLSPDGAYAPGRCTPTGAAEEPASIVPRGSGFLVYRGTNRGIEQTAFDQDGAFVARTFPVETPGDSRVAAVAQDGADVLFQRAGYETRSCGAITAHTVPADGEVSTRVLPLPDDEALRSWRAVGRTGGDARVAFVYATACRQADESCAPAPALDPYSSLRFAILDAAGDRTGRVSLPSFHSPVVFLDGDRIVIVAARGSLMLSRFDADGVLDASAAPLPVIGEPGVARAAFAAGPGDYWIAYHTEPEVGPRRIRVARLQVE